MPDLSNIEIKNLKDVGMTRVSNNLYINVTVKGTKIWKYRKLFNGQAVVISFGKYPAITLKQARNLTEIADLYFDSGVDHRKTREKQKQNKKTSNENTFKTIASLWIKSKNYEKKTYNDSLSKLSRYINPHLGKMLITDIEAKDILVFLKELEADNKLETLRKSRGIVRLVFDYAIANGLCKHNPTYNINRATKSAIIKHLPP